MYPEILRKTKERAASNSMPGAVAMEVAKWVVIATPPTRNVKKLLALFAIVGRDDLHKSKY